MCVPPRHDFGCGSDDQPGIDSVHRIRISRLADFHDAPVFDPNVALYYSPMIYDQRVGDDEVQSAWRVFALRFTALAHAVANDFAAAEGDLVAVNSKVLFDLND